MSMKIRPDYINPLTMVDKKAAAKTVRPASGQTDKVSELQTKQQQLQNQVLLLKASGTDGAGASAETQKVLEAQLKQVSTELRSAKAEAGRAVAQASPAELERQRPAQDWYEPEEPQTASPGIYQVERDGQEGWRISFLPYSEE